MHSIFAFEESGAGKKQRTRSIVNASTFLIVIVASVWIFSAPLREPTHMMPFVADDFYYYLKVAQNVAHGLDSTLMASRAPMDTIRSTSFFLSSSAK